MVFSEQLIVPVTERLKSLKTMLAPLIGGNLERFCLYGSRARGDYDEDSDTDVAIVVKGLDRELKDKILRRIAEFEMENIFPVSALVISDEDFAFLKSRERRIALDIESEGVSI